MLWYHKIGTAEGLSSQDFNFYVYVDSEGYSWIGSSTGLNRFNGKQVRQYRANLNDSTALYGESIQSRFFEDSRRNLWFSTYEAIHLYDRRRDQFRHFFVLDKDNNPVKENYYVIHLEQDSVLWFRVGAGIYRVNVLDQDKTQTAFSKAQPLFETVHYHGRAGLDKDGAVQYIFTYTNEKRTGMECFGIEHGKLGSEHAFFDSSGRNTPVLGIFQVHYQDREHIWMSTNKGLVQWRLFDPQSIRIFPISFEGYSYFTPDGDRFFLVTFLDKGLFRFDKTSGRYSAVQLRAIGAPGQTGMPDLRNIYLDSAGVLWITVPYGGVIYAGLHKRKFNAFPYPAFMLDKRHSARNLLENPDGSVWCGYNEGMVLLDADGRLLRTVTSGGAASALKVNHIFKQRDGTVWLATTQGIYQFTGAGNTCTLLPGTAGIDFLYLYALRCGQLIATTLQSGIFSFDRKNNQWRMRKLIHAPEGIGYTSVYEDQSHQVYICRNESAIDMFACIGDSLQWKGVLPVNGAINAWYEPPGGHTLWIGTAYGLVRTDIRRPEQSIVFFTEKDGLADNNVLSIAADNSGNLWLGTNNGLTVCTPGALPVFRNFGMADGIQSLQFNQYAALQRSDGDVWMAGTAGITIIPRQINSSRGAAAAILLSEIKVNDLIPQQLACSETGSAHVNHIRQLEFGYEDNTLSFSFVAADYADPSGAMLRYRMQSVDKSWVTLGEGEPGFARYPNLPPGNYIFEIQAANSEGEWEETGRQIKVRIIPPFWQTWWFRAGMITLCLALIILLARFRINQVRKTEQLKRRIAENKMAALVAQMNPHFIFNSLQSINSYILKNDRQQASEYLGRFARLMRMILENSRTTRHSLEKEKELLELYLKVEAQRFKEPFTYQVEIDENLDAGNVEIPGMMLQPFVENAIWHGLAHKSGSGHIQIRISAEGNLLRCVVTDNGAGRLKAAEINLQKGKTHTSRALQIVEERLHLLFPDQQDLCSIQYIDLFDNTGEAAGTRVEITLPKTD